MSGCSLPLGLQPLDNQSRIMLMEIIEDRHKNGSVIITSQIPVSCWYDVIGEKTIAETIMDRLVHEVYKIDLEGESMRKIIKTVENNEK